MSTGRGRRRRRLQPADTGPYVLKKVMEEIPLVADDEVKSVSITCVEFWNDNLYVGTTASEILHLVSLPGETEVDPPQYILASRLQPSGHDVAPDTQVPGVQQILVLPGVFKACVLCNGTASFYSLPELTPAFPNREPTGVQWIGGYDENSGRDNEDGTAIMIATSKRILQVRVGDKLKPVRPNIEFPDCLNASRRDTIACVADAKNYALLEIEHQQKIPLFDISTALEPEHRENKLLLPPAAHSSTHGRSKSLGDFTSSQQHRDLSPGKVTLSPSASIDRARSPAQPVLVDAADARPGSRPRSATGEASPAAPARTNTAYQPLRPHILSPFANEFMLTTGTTASEPGVGMFVNSDGDVSRGTLEFDHYPLAVMACSFNQSPAPSSDSGDDQMIVALLEKQRSQGTIRGLQIQSISSNDSTTAKTWLEFGGEGIPGTSDNAGLHHCLSPQKHIFDEVAALLQAVRYSPRRHIDMSMESDPRTNSPIERLEKETALFDHRSDGSTSPTPDYVAKRALEELQFVQRLGHVATHALTWFHGNLWQVLPNPLLLQLEGQIDRTIAITEEGYDFQHVNVPQLLSFLGSVRDQEPRNETEFLSIRYARQKASIVLFAHLLTGLKHNPNLKAACKLAENALLEAEVDPRLPLSLLRPISGEVIYGRTGIWIQQGINACLTDFDSSMLAFSECPTEFWLMIRHFLSSWQEKRGASGSLSDEQAIFDSVDAALLHLLLQLDSNTASNDAAHAPTRVKLNNVVDHWKGDFDRAVVLLEHYKRLFILSRLYQSKKSSKDVLQTWKRICEGEKNTDEDVSPDQIYHQMRRYLTLLRDNALVEEYAIWLAQRSPDLAVQVLSDDQSRIRFAPAEVVLMLKARAPGSVQLFLEHLVFNKNLDQYADDLVGYYLDSVLSMLEQSNQARQSLADSYTTYRALTSPKPTYLSFIKENAPEEPWWQSRLRLLQLLGTGGYATASGSNKTLTYSIDKVLDRLSPFSTYLVSESIILDARQGRHKEALKLLVHGLGDYDTAVRYCYFGGPSTPSGTIDISMLPSRRQQQDQFYFLFTEFLQIADLEERLDRTSHLLGTFATWFDPLIILNSIPDSWSVSTLSEFLLRSFRAATTERNQAIIIKALSAAQNLQKQAQFIETCEKIGAKLEIENSPLDQSQNDVATN